MNSLLVELFRPGELVTAVGGALDADILAHRVELDQHIAAIAAAHRLHQLAEILRPRFERLAHARAWLLRQFWRFGYAVVGGAVPAEREGEVEARLGAGAAA